MEWHVNLARGTLQYRDQFDQIPIKSHAIQELQCTSERFTFGTSCKINSQQQQQQQLTDACELWSGRT